MNGNHDDKKPLPFQAPAGTPIVGQPFTLSNVSLPVNGTMTCNCVQPGIALPFVASAPAACPHCHAIYVVAFNPQNGQLTIARAYPEAEKVQS